ncbi:MAG: NAD-dependent epimerase/dehydratase family protein [Candidatus Omnitrophota bacterium]
MIANEKMDFLKDKKILITGATGLVGTNALMRFKRRPDIKVRAVYHAREPHVFSNNISYVKADLTNFADCKRVVEGIDYVMMFAAKINRRGSDPTYLVPNFLMNFCMLEAAYQEGVKKLLWLSSVTAYPPSDKPLKEEQMFKSDPCDFYFPLGWMTRYIEILCRMYATKLKRQMTTIIFRSTAIYGEYGDFELSTCHVLSALIRKVVERHRPLEIWGTGEAKRDFIYVGDVVDACFLALEKVNTFNEFNIGLGQSYSVKEILDLILDIDNYNNASIIFDKSKSEKDISIFVDCTKTKEVLGFEAKTAIIEGVRKTIEWYKESIG